MTFEEFNKQFPYLVLVTNLQNQIVHMCGYVNEPTVDDVELLGQELATDEEFDLIEEAKNDQLSYYYQMTSESESLYNKFSI